LSTYPFERTQQIGIVLRRNQPARREPDESISDSHLLAHQPTPIRTRLKFLTVDAVQKHDAPAGRHSLESNETIGSSLAHRGSSAGKRIRKAVRQHPHLSTFVHIVHRGENSRRWHEEPEQPRQSVCMKAVAVNQVRLKLAKEAPRPYNTH